MLKPIIKILLCAATFSACAHQPRHHKNICGVDFNLDENRFSIGAHENGSCAFFAIIKSGGEKAGMGSIIVSNKGAPSSLETVPSNFFAQSDGEIVHRTPNPVSDGKNFYFVKDIAAIKKNDFLSDGYTIKISSYARTLDEIREISETELEEITESQTCVDAIKYNQQITIFFTGCEKNSGDSSLFEDVSKLMRGDHIMPL